MMDSDKKSRFKVINGGLSQKKSPSLDQNDKLTHQIEDNKHKLIEQRIEELKRIRPELQNIDLSQSENIDFDAFQFIWREIFDPEYQKQQQNNINQERFIEEKTITEILNTRLEQLKSAYPNINFHSQNFLHLPEIIKVQLFAPPLLLLDDGSLMLFND